MKVRLFFSFWYLPLLGIFFGIIYIFVYQSGIAVTWQYIGKPSSNISKIIGFVGYKLFVTTEKGEVYSITYDEYWAGGGNSIPKPVQWVKEGNNNIVPDQIPYRDWDYMILPPLFKVKQEYEMVFQEIEESSTVKFDLSEDGNLWMWNYGTGEVLLVIYCIAPIFGGLAGGLLAALLFFRKIVKLKAHF